MRILSLLILFYGTLGFSISNVPELHGNKEISKFEILNEISIDYTAERYEAIAAKVMELYRQRGFYNVRVDFGPPYQHMEIYESKPCIIDEVRIIDEGVAIPDKVKSEIVYSGIRHRELDRCSQATFASYQKNLLTWIKENNYPFAKLSNFSNLLDDTQTEIDIQVKVYLGPKVDLDFSGISHFHSIWKRLAEWISPVSDLKTLRESTFTATNLDEYCFIVKSFLESLYKKKGYEEVVVKVAVTESSESHATVTASVEEGPRWYLGAKPNLLKIVPGFLGLIKADVTWDGLHAPEDEFREKNLTKIIQEKLKSYRGSTNIYIIYDEKIVQEAMNDIEKLYQKNGYLFAKLSHAFEITNATEDVKKVKLHVTVNEGTQTKVNSITFDGIGDQLKEKDLQEAVQVFPGKPFNLVDFEGNVTQLENWLREKGYFDVSVTVPKNKIFYSPDNKLVDIKIKVDLGVTYKADDIYTVGNFFTKDATINDRHMIIQPGEELTPALIRKAQSKLATQTPLQSVDLELEKDPSTGQADIRIKVAESQPGSAEIGPFARSDLGIGVTGQIGYNNLFRRMISATLQARLFTKEFTSVKKIKEFNNWQYTNTLQMKYPKPFRIVPIDLSLFGSFRKRDLPNFDYHTRTIGFGPSYNSDSFEAAINYEVAWTDVYNAYKTELDETFRLASLIPRVGYQWTTKKDEIKINFSHIHEVTLEEFGSSEPFNFQRPISRVMLNWNLGSTATFRSRNQMGYLVPFSSGDRFPLNKRFRLGSYETMRGFWQDSISFDKERDVSEMSMIASSNDLICWTSDLVGIGALYDFGNVYATRKFKAENTPYPEFGLFRSNYGISLDASSPLGIFNFGLARPTKYLPWEDSWRFFFSFFN